jgi:hypothetical protein
VEEIGEMGFREGNLRTYMMTEYATAIAPVRTSSPTKPCDAKISLERWKTDGMIAMSEKDVRLGSVDQKLKG